MVATILTVMDVLPILPLGRMVPHPLIMVCPEGVTGPAHPTGHTAMDLLRGVGGITGHITDIGP